jgi:hypothetical protein
MRGRSVILVATVFAVTGVAIIGGLWSAGDERGSEVRRSTTVTADEAARVAKRVVESLVREVEAGRMRVPVLHCKLTTPRQRYWCGSARRLTPSAILTPPDLHQPTSCLVQSEAGDLWLVYGVGRCWSAVADLA